MATVTRPRSVMVIGSGPIVIGQASEFDYSGVQALKVLKQEGIRVVLLNSNPATIMTDPDYADATYIEPLTAEICEKVIAKERPDALLPTLGGQTALNLAMELERAGVLARHGVQMIGATPRAIELAENRIEFKRLLERIELSYPEVCKGPLSIRGDVVKSLDDGRRLAEQIGFPVMLRPSYILGGAGTGIARNEVELLDMLATGLAASPVGEVLMEESIAGWKEFELEVMRDRNDNCVVVCSIENLDPMGIHTGDSITVAPIQTLTDVQYQNMRTLAFIILREVGVETGGSNVQFAVNPATGRMVVVEMNPRVSRSSALASKATGFPIAKIATKLAIGYTLDEINNDITKVTPASFEPALDYVVVKVPRWVFEKFAGVPDTLGTKMQSVGEAMAIGRSFAEALQKALRSIERSRAGLNADPIELGYRDLGDEDLAKAISVATPDRIFLVGEAIRRGMEIKAIADASSIDPWFLAEMKQIYDFRGYLESKRSPAELSKGDFAVATRLGFSDSQLAYLLGSSEGEVSKHREKHGFGTVYKSVDTCAGEFEAFTPYFYGSYGEENEATSLDHEAVIILGSGPNRIGQGIEFDYCCVHACFALREAGYDSIMINSNPETVSTDYDTSSRLYMEPLDGQAVKAIIAHESSVSDLRGVMLSFGGQTPLKLASALDPQQVLGTSPEAIDRAEDRKRWSHLCSKLKILQPDGGTVTTLPEALEVAGSIGYPVLIRPSYVLGGRAMEIVYNEQQLATAFARLAELSSEGRISAEAPILIDKFLEGATEVDVDAIRDRHGDFLLGAIMEHVEEAGIHSGDSACTIPPVTLSQAIQDAIVRATRSIADELGVVGLINVQFAVLDGKVYVIEANPRASRTVPFVAKATGVPLAKIAARVAMGQSLKELRASKAYPMDARSGYVAVKEAVLPFTRFPEADSLLGPEMRSTGEVMGIDHSFELAFAKSQIAAGNSLPKSGMVFLSLADRDKKDGLRIAKGLTEMGFQLAATSGTAAYLVANGVDVALEVDKVNEEFDQPDYIPTEGKVDAVDLINSKKVVLVINTPRGSGPRVDGRRIRSAAQKARVPSITTIEAGLAAVGAIKALRESELEVHSLQEFHCRSI